MIFHCCDELRRNAVAAHPTLNGIDFLEVLDGAAPAGSPPQRTLLVRLLKEVPAGLAPEQVRIEGGERVRAIAVDWVGAADGPPPQASAAEQAFLAAMPEAANVLVVRTEREGDFSQYRLRLVRGAGDATPPAGFDPRLAEIEFSFKVECPSDFDCRPVTTCPEEPRPAPVIDYLAKDYPGFRRLVLDRITQLVPGWQEVSAADVGVTLAELVAYVADQLSYEQDAVATEAYLGTARLRTSLRRHARLVDYHVHDGCNARAWVHVPVEGSDVPLPREGTRLLTTVPAVPWRIAPDSPDDDAARLARPLVFEPMHDSVLHAEHNELSFYTWGDGRCCLPAGGTRATLAGHLPRLRPGDVVLLEEVAGPLTGEAGDADPSHRQVVRLTAVSAFSPDDPASPRTDPLNGEAITEVEWGDDDRLAVPFCVSSVTDDDHGSVPVGNVSVARANMVLVDHGETLATPDDLGTVPPPRLFQPRPGDRERCAAGARVAVPPRFRPALGEGPLTFQATVARTVVEDGQRRSERVPFDPQAPAAQAMRWSMDETRPAVVELTGTVEGTAEGWTLRRDLLDSAADAPHAVVEVEHDGSARLRFGDDTFGRRPRPGTGFTARYRVGNGRIGNVGAESIRHVVTSDARVLGARNPLPAQGGTDPEDAATIRRRAPHAFRRQERAVTPADYAEVTRGHPGVERAAAALRWTGSWHTVFVTVDRTGGIPVDAAFERELTGRVERYRMAGHDTEFNDPVYVSLELDLLVCVESTFLRSDVRAGLLEVLGNQARADGRRGLFHPDELTFGHTVFLSSVYAAARTVPGVASVEATRFHRQGNPDPRPLVDGFMRLAALEIPRLDNDANFPEHGVLRLTLVGGK